MELIIPLIHCIATRQIGKIFALKRALQLLYAMDKWAEALENGEEVDCIYTDFMKAFDQR